MRLSNTLVPNSVLAWRSPEDPMIVRSLLRSRGTRSFYQVRVGTDTRAAANELCGSLRKLGGAPHRALAESVMRSRRSPSPLNSELRQCRRDDALLVDFWLHEPS